MMSDLGNKKIMAKNISFYMNQYNMTRYDLCDRLGISYMTVSDWINAKKYPRIDKIEMMARIFNVQKSDLVEEHKPKKHPFRIPVLGSVPAGIPLEAIQDVLDWEEISEEMARLGEYFALRIRGNSMEPRIREGDVVIIRRQEHVENGEIAVVMINGDDATIKKFYNTGSGVMLVGLNPTFEPLTYTPDQVAALPIRVIGKVVELRAKF